MSSLTRNQRLPYPASDREYGNGALDSEVLARTVAKRLDVLDVAWSGELLHHTDILTLTSNVTGIASGTQNDLTLTNVEKRVGTFVEGWYHVNALMAAQASGTVNAGSRRQFQANVWRTTAAGLEAEDSYYVEEAAPASGDTNQAVSFVTHLDAVSFVRLGLYHSNTSSTLTILAYGTRITKSLIVADSAL